jgi:hypothetical protein
MSPAFINNSPPTEPLPSSPALPRPSKLSEAHTRKVFRCRLGVGAGLPPVRVSRLAQAAAS